MRYLTMRVLSSSSNVILSQMHFRIDANIRSLGCSYLLTVPIKGNYHPETWICVNFLGAYRSSTSDHSEQCKKHVKNRFGLMEGSKIPASQNESTSMESIIEWESNTDFLSRYIRQNPQLGPKALKGHMEKLKQKFSLRVIKEKKKEIIEELFPKDRKIAFCSSNCLCLNYEDSFEDNLYRYYGQILSIPKDKVKRELNQNLQEFYIFANSGILHQLEHSKQWFIDGTFSVSPIGFQQLLVIVVYLTEWKLFYPACYILATNKSEFLYKNIFRSLIGVARDLGFNLKPELISTDFEKGLQNAVISEFNAKDKLIGCFFHYVKALVTKAKQTGLIRKNNFATEAKVLLGLLKILAHCPPEIKNEFFDQIEDAYKKYGQQYKIFLQYYKRNWLNNNFLDNLYEAYQKDSEISFIRTNNPCEIFNRYLGKPKIFF